MDHMPTSAVARTPHTGPLPIEALLWSHFFVIKLEYYEFHMYLRMASIGKCLFHMNYYIALVKGNAYSILLKRNI